MCDLQTWLFYQFLGALSSSVDRLWPPSENQNCWRVSATRLHGLRRKTTSVLGLVFSFTRAIIHVFLLTRWRIHTYSRIHKPKQMCRKHQVKIHRPKSLFWIKNLRSPHVSLIGEVFNFLYRHLKIRFKAKQWVFTRIYRQCMSNLF